MLLIEAKAIGYQEEMSFKAGVTDDATMKENAKVEVYETTYKLVKISEATDEVQASLTKLNLDTTLSNYYVTNEALEIMGLSQITDNGGYYIISFNDQTFEIEIYNTNGYELDDETIIYKLSELEVN